MPYKLQDIFPGVVSKATAGSAPRERWSNAAPPPPAYLASDHCTCRTLAQHTGGRLRGPSVSQELGLLQVTLVHLHPTQSVASVPGFKKGGDTLALHIYDDVALRLPRNETEARLSDVIKPRFRRD